MQQQPETLIEWYVDAGSNLSQVSLWRLLLTLTHFCPFNLCPLDSDLEIRNFFVLVVHLRLALVANQVRVGHKILGGRQRAVRVGTRLYTDQIIADLVVACHASLLYVPFDTHDRPDRSNAVSQIGADGH